VSVISSYVKKQLKKHGFAGFLMRIGDVAVKLTPNPADDVVWAKARKILKAGKVADLLRQKNKEASG
jgi:hypothetical protein|tara:strand:- start:370 stop:570 length:201 start_codon:yes stop_codon:yes gene_type:complete